VDAMVVAQGLPASLLGMSYLGRLSRLEATPQALILRP
jgi:aspartyl protease family protein